MTTLLMRLAAPLQSWGNDAKFNKRGTSRIPTKSGVIGLICAALGRRRDDDMSDLAGLNFGVRVDQPGTQIRDFHSAHEEAFWHKRDGKYAHITTRFYLADAVFVVGLSGPETLLHQVDEALRTPVFPLYLGRRSCPPQGRVSLGIRPGRSVKQALSEEPWQVNPWRRRGLPAEIDLELIVDTGPGVNGSYYVHDLPLSFDPANREYGFRLVVDGPNVTIRNVDRWSYYRSEHDPMQLLEE